MHFFANANPANEYFLVAFNQHPQVLLESTSDPSDVLSILDRMARVELKGQTALYDTLYLALDKVARRKHPRRALILVTDGQDNMSKYRFTDVRRALMESDATLYAIGLVDSPEGALGYGGKAILETLTDIAGGLSFFPRTRKEFNDALEYVAAELRNRYTLGIIPALNEKKNGWHEIKIKVSEQRDSAGKKVKLRLRAREGFYGATRSR